MKEIEKRPHFKHKLYLLRHGETEWSKSGQHTGSSDIPLTEAGELQAKALGKALKGLSFTKVLLSPLQRAVRTCELAGYREQAEIREDLYELRYGEYEGVTTKEIRQHTPGWTVFSHPSPGGETLQQVAARADRILEEVYQVQGDVALFSSGHYLRILGARWLGLSPEWGKHLKLSTASICVLSYEHENQVIEVWNDTSHMTS